MIKRVINDYWHIDEHYQLVKTSNDQPLNLDEEPVFILRARDNLAITTLVYYLEIAKLNHCTDYLTDSVKGSIEKFKQFALRFPNRMKQPGITRGK